MIEELNGLLRSAKAGVAIAVRGNRVYLVATLPGKPGSGKEKHQQRVSLGVAANPIGLQTAYQKALLLSAQIAAGVFEWSAWVEEPPAKVMTIGEALGRFERDWHRRWGDDPGRRGTWRKDYRAVLSRLPKDWALDPDKIKRWIEANSKPDTRTRKKMCDLIGVFLKHFGVEHDLRSIRGRYSPSTVARRDLPTDDQIVEAWRRIERKDWAWVYGMLATFGLRNHEVFFVDLPYLSSAGICHVLEGKTVGGKVWPFYPDWVDLFDLRNPVMPKVKANDHIEYGQRVTTWFYKNKNIVPFTAYSLRHCWARRAISLGLDSRLAAKQMRHSHAVHTSAYNKWIDDAVHEQAFEQIKAQLQKPPRP